jgi:hypothetical protein
MVDTSFLFQPAVFQLCYAGMLPVLQTLDSSQQTAHVGDIRQAVRFAVSDLKGQDLLPGFCLPKVISCLTEEGAVALLVS